MFHHQLLDTEVEDTMADLEHPEDSLVEDSPAVLDILEAQDFPEDLDIPEGTDLMEINGTRDFTRIPRVISSAT